MSGTKATNALFKSPSWLEAFRDMNKKSDLFNLSDNNWMIVTSMIIVANKRETAARWGKGDHQTRNVFICINHGTALHMA